MSGFWILFVTFCTMYQPGRRWVTAQSTESSVHQPDKELIVDIGDSATLRCCISERDFGHMAWIKQIKGKKLQLIVDFFETAGETFHTGFNKSRFQIKRFSNCFSMTILNITQSDEAVYFCAITFPNTVFGDGTYLKVEETSKPALNDNSVMCEATLHGNNTNMNTQDKTVIGLGTALGLCALLIFCLTYFILRRIINDNYRLSASFENCPEMRLVSEAETLNYAVVQFSKRKAKDEKRKTGSSDNCVYADVKKSCNVNDL
ncbi:uncharacterized protein LOC131357750 isoform X2 [Hemibagrus wyckioides]|uniref:uncharacterized protein LOC131357750 isoform X2 n=1 Tax=Hemibagrus wyckioides TaxID=337641 RepID=UPI00266D442E|nr:uncharacterized protein LOC131357750 isoform X2 [Hemibagrus wyckioides]